MEELLITMMKKKQGKLDESRFINNKCREFWTKRLL